ncbi:MAG: hypothetical protein EHM13_03895 [Acidobacteria bacterium]|nr:MAG: hypothetical protein EHM13_03895 [Acidobacteriota bacterium]
MVPTDAAAQENNGPNEVRRVFIDCADMWCDESFIRAELTFVNFVRDRKEADVHALITAQGTGGGGREYTVALIGLGRFAGIDHRLVYLSTNSDTDDSIRRGIARVLRLGLVHYVVDSAFGSQLDVVHRRAEGVESASKGARDPWNSWVFRASLRGSGSGEESRRSTYVSGSLSANRVTEHWKVNNSVGGNYSHARYTFTEGDIYTSISKAWSASSLVVKSIGPHWSAGARASVSSSTFVNQDIAVRLAPAVEYNIYPYKDSTRRQLTINYALGLNAYDYREVTIFEKMREGKLDETLTVSWDLRQPWGTTSTTFQASHYLPGLRRHRLVVFTEADVRLFKGFSLFGYGSVSRIRNQLYLPKGEATPEEVLVRQRQLATSYQYSLSIGFSYSFGSIFNNVVNSRFHESGIY